MTVALVSRTIVLAAWFLLLLGHRAASPVAVASAVALLAVWAASLVRDRRRAAVS
jgi:hypothetical protein